MPSRLPGGWTPSGLVARLRSLWRGIRRRREIESEMEEEFRHHLELRTADLVRRGVPPPEAARRARLEFGHVEAHKEEARASRGLRLVDEIRFSSLDVKLGLRMVAKYPGLSLVSVIGMSVAIAIGAGAFGFLGAMMDPALPLPQGDRLVSIQHTSTRRPGVPERRSLHELAEWRSEVVSIDDLSAFTSDSRTLVVPGGGADLVRVARMTPSGFRAARVAPILGRALLDEDDRPGAPAVVVIGEEEWRGRFGADPGILGRAITLGTGVHTVVGVMPAGFGFPINHRYWVPLRLDPADYERGAGPSIFVFGRLAHGATLAQAQAEMATIGARMAAAYPETHGHLRPEVLAYPHPHVGIDSPGMAWAVRAGELAISLLLVIVAINVAILVYARTVTRTGEIAVRTALGASRRRVVAQLFAEALVLSLVAAAIGLTLAGAALGAIQDFQERASDWQLPFWFDLGLTPGLVAYVVALAVVAGVIVGVLPALQATGRSLGSGLQRLPSRGSQMRLGRTWTALIVTQVAITVAVLPAAVYVSGQAIARGAVAPGYAADRVLRAHLSIERDEGAPPIAAAVRSAGGDRFARGTGELLRRLESEPEVVGTALASGFPGLEGFARIEVEGTDARLGTRVNDVDPSFFDVLGVPVLAGRAFDASDLAEGANAIVVDRVFADRLLGGRPPLGRRVRTWVRPPGAEPGALEEGPWLEVVGVVPDFSPQADYDPADPTFYRPARSFDGRGGVVLSVRIRAGVDPAAFAPRLREITAAVDPALQLHELRSASDAEWDRQRALLGIALAVLGVTVSVLLLSAAGVYAMMSFTVERRRREIGIRSALGANPRRLLAGILGRASAQLGAGVVCGLVLATALAPAVGAWRLAGRALLLLPAVAALIVAVGLLATLGPARRGLAVQPTEALRAE